MVKIKDETSVTPALQGRAPGPKLNCAPQQLPGGLTQYYEPRTRRPKSSSREFKTAMPHIHLEYNERQMLAFLICCWSPGSTFAIFKAAKPFPSWSATAQPHPPAPPTTRPPPATGPAATTARHRPCQKFHAARGGAGAGLG